eukprot:5544647-Amphidinium_carterae.1
MERTQKRTQKLRGSPRTLCIGFGLISSIPGSKRLHWSQTPHLLTALASTEQHTILRPMMLPSP